MNGMMKLSIGDIISNAISMGLKNAPSLILMAILYVITIWIPYLNIGTTIGVWDQLVKMGRGESISPTEIFDPKYRERIGDFFLLLAFVAAGSVAGLVIPGAGAVIALAWLLALPLFVDQQTDPLESLTQSNRMTYGNKLTIFLAFAVLGIGIALVAILLTFLLRSAPIVLMLAMLIVYLLVLPIYYSALAYIYHRLVDGAGAEAVEPSAVPAM